ncbi:MAG: CARDB domain-containing protein, partial [Patulibacter sp.]
ADVQISLCGGEAVNEASCLLSSNLLPGASWNFGPILLRAPNPIHPATLAVTFRVSRPGDVNHLNDSLSFTVPFEKSSIDFATLLDPASRTVTVGDTVAYTLTTSGQADPLVGATATVAAPEGVTLGNISDSDCTFQSGAPRGLSCDLGSTPNRTITFDATFADVDPQATLTSGIGSESNLDPVPANDQATSAVTVNALPVDLVTTASADEGVAAGKVRYRVEVRNEGPNDVREGVLTGELPEGVAFDSSDGTCSAAARVVTCDVGEIDSDESAITEIVGLVDGDRAGQTLTASFDASSELRETEPADNATTASFLVLPTVQSVILSGPPAVTEQSTASFTYASDARQPTFECRLDDAAFDACPSSGISYVDLPVGDHHFAVRAIDVAGNVGPPTLHTWSRVPHPVPLPLPLDPLPLGPVAPGPLAPFVPAPAPAPPSIPGATRPRIGTVRVSGPTRVRRGEKATYRIAVTNAGDAAAQAVRIRVTGKGVVEHRTALRRIAAGATRTFPITIRAKITGRVRLSFRVSSPTAGHQTAQKTITVGR